MEWTDVLLQPKQNITSRKLKIHNKSALVKRNKLHEKVTAALPFGQ